MTEPMTDTTSAGSTRGLGPVVVGIDAAGSSDAAVQWAARTAGRWEVPLVLVRSYGPAPQERLEFDLTVQEAKDAVEEQLDVLHREILERHPALDVQWRAVPGDAGAALVKEASAAGLVVVGSHGRGATGRLLLGSVSHAVVTRSRTAVAVVRTDVDEPDGPVVVGVELPAIPQEAIDFAAREARLRGVPLVVAYAWHLSGPYSYAEVGPDSGALEAIRKSEEHELETLVGRVREANPGLDVQGRMAAGAPAAVLADAAERATLLVVGTHGRGAMGRLVLGSVSTNVLHEVPTPVVVVPSHHRRD